MLDIFTILKGALVVVIAYLMGNIATGLIVTRLYSHKDVREHGSGSSGSTNVVRTAGLVPGLITFAMDLLKGYLATLIGWLLLGDIGAMIAGVCVTVGHIFPVLLKFKGGKGVTPALGSLFLFQPLPALIVLVLSFLFIFIIRIVSVVSLGNMLLMVVYELLGYFVFGTVKDIRIVIYVAVMVAIAFFAHRENLKRIFTGQEKKLTLGKR